MGRILKPPAPILLAEDERSVFLAGSLVADLEELMRAAREGVRM